MKRLPRPALFSLVALASLAMAFGLLSRLVPGQRYRFAYATGALAPERYQALARAPGWSASEVEVAPGVRLKGLVRRPASPSAPWLLFLPGNDTSQLTTGQALLTHLAAGEDWGLAVFAYRGFESSPGTPRVDELAADATFLLGHLRRQEALGTRPVHLVGFSIGGHLAVRAAADAARAGHPAASLTLLAAVDDIVMVRPSPWQRVDPGDAFQTRRFLGDVPAPVLVLQGEADEALGGPGQGRALAAALGARGRYVELPGLGHAALLADQRALAEAHRFLVDQAGAPAQR